MGKWNSNSANTDISCKPLPFLLASEWIQSLFPTQLFHCTRCSNEINSPISTICNKGQNKVKPYSWDSVLRKLQEQETMWKTMLLMGLSIIKSENSPQRVLAKEENLMNDGTSTL